MTMSFHYFRGCGWSRRGVPTLIAAFLAVGSLGSILVLVPYAGAQISLTSAVDLALSSNPRVKSAQDDVNKAQAQLAEARDAYIPSLSMGSALGQAYGYSPYPPTFFTVSSGSLIYSSSQKDFIRSARDGVRAAQLAFEDVRETVAEDTVLGWIALDHDEKRAAVTRQQHDSAIRLVQIVQDRLDAGQDSQIGLTQAKLSEAELHQALQHAEDEVANDREHLARLIGLPSTSLAVAGDFPATPIPISQKVEGSPTSPSTGSGYANAGVAAAFAGAQARHEQAAGESRFRYWPQINLFSQYNRYATFTNSFAQLKELEPALTANEAAVGVQITVPFIDKSRQAKARQSSADAARAFHDAQNAEIQALDAQSKLHRSVEELQTQAEVAGLRQQLAQQQLDILRLELQTGNPGGAPMTPKDEQNAIISEREKYMGVLDADFQLRQAEIQLLRTAGQLTSWLKSAASQRP
jgi:outer membrane protein TolC